MGQTAQERYQRETCVRFWVVNYMKYFLLALLCLPNFALASIEIIEVMCNPVGSDSDGEWVKIKNTGDTTIDITGWKFNDGSNHILNVPPKNGGIGDMLIAAGEEVLLANDATKVSGASTIIDTVMSMSNSGDTVSLIDSDAVEVHAITYTSDQVVEGESCSATVAPAGEATDTQAVSTVSVSNVTQYRTVEVEPPQDIFIRSMPDITSVVGSNTYIKPELYNAIGRVTDSGCYVTFGDGSYSNKCATSHIYEYAGEYIVKVSITEGTLHDEAVLTVRVIDPSLRLKLAEDNKFVEIFNDDPLSIELNLWSLVIGSRRFKIPEGTIIAGSSSIKISSKTMRIDMARHRGFVKLVNIFNTTIADSRLFTPVEPVLTPVVSEGVQEQLVPLQDIASITQEEAPIVATKSVVGSKVVVPTVAYVTDIITSNIQEEDAILSKGKPNTVVLAASAGLLPDEYGKWAVGLLALMGIAITPLLLGAGKDGGHEDLSNVELDTFTIEEVK